MAGDQQRQLPMNGTQPISNNTSSLQSGNNGTFLNTGPSVPSLMNMNDVPTSLHGWRVTPSQWTTVGPQHPPPRCCVDRSWPTLDYGGVFWLLQICALSASESTRWQLTNHKNNINLQIISQFWNSEAWKGFHRLKNPYVILSGGYMGGHGSLPFPLSRGWWHSLACVLVHLRSQQWQWVPWWHPTLTLTLPLSTSLKNPYSYIGPPT